MHDRVGGAMLQSWQLEVMHVTEEVVYGRSELLVFGVVLFALIGTNELGYRLARRRSAQEPERALVSGIQGALMGLFALLLGFTFAMAIARFDTRTTMVVKESNAIGTAVLRARLLPDDQAPDALELFRRYVDVRVEAAHGPNLPSAKSLELDAEAARIQLLLWAHAEKASKSDPHSISAGLFVQGVNEVIDVKGERDAGLANHVPESVLLLLLGFAVLTSGILGFANGLSGDRALTMSIILTALISLVMLTIVDLDRPRRGVIHVSQESMLSLQKSLN